MNNGSGPAHGGSKIKSSTKAGLRGESTTPFSDVFRYPSGGLVEVPHSRRAEAKSKNNRNILAKELRMARIFAHAGDKIVFTPKGAGNHDVFCNGVPAELKKTGSANHIVHHAEKAVAKQGAKIVLFEFTKDNKDIRDKIAELRRKGYKGKYYFSHSKNDVYDL